jgi:hypothetical protein
MAVVGIGTGTIDSFMPPGLAGAKVRYRSFTGICFEIHTSARRTSFNFCIAIPLIGGSC